MELQTLSPCHVHLHPAITAREEEEEHIPSGPPPAPASTTQTQSSPRSPQTRDAASSIVSRLKTWWSTHIRLVVIEQTSVPSPSPPPSPSRTEEQDQYPSKEVEEGNGAEEEGGEGEAEETAEGEIECDPRDFLALERTFLAYVRTSLALVSFGIVVTQLFVLKKVDPGKGAALGGVTEVGGILIVLVGCVRYFRQQKLFARGKTIAAGWDLMAVEAMLAGVILTMLVIVLVEG
jgi:uncharacterized membrane protein YidH (DUF202 family)